jgi:hypothetical protein
LEFLSGGNIVRTIHSVVAAAALVLACGKDLNAGLVWDYSPATYSGATQSPEIGYGLTNLSTAQNFAERVFILNSTSLTGMDIYARSSGGGLTNPVALGASTTIRIWNDLVGTPDGPLHNFTETVSVIDTDGALGTDVIRIHVDFTNPVVLDANTEYWVGMSGTSVNIGQLGLAGVMAPENSRMYRFNGTTPIIQTGDFAGDMAFRLHGDEITEVSSTPEPASMALLGSTGIGGIGWRMRRRRKVLESQIAA